MHIDTKINGERDFYQERMLDKVASMEWELKKIRVEAESTGGGFPNEALSHVATLAAQAGAYAAKYEVLRDIEKFDNQ